MVPTALGDTFLGVGCAALSLGSFSANAQLLLVCLASLFLYAGGMVQNDIADAAADKKANAPRPLVNGRIRPSSAMFMFVALWGVAAACVVLLAILTPSYLSNTVISQKLLVALAALAVAVVVTVYNFTHKRFRIASPFLMGLARMLNALFAAFALGLTLEDISYDRIILAVLFAYGLYVSAVTFLSLLEDREEDRFPLVCAVLAALLSLVAASPLLWFEAVAYWFLLLLLVVLAFLVTTGWLLSCPLRRKLLPLYVPALISPVALLGGLAAIFFSLGDPMRLLVPGLLVAAVFPAVSSYFVLKAGKLYARLDKNTQE
ncbi:MAG: UbiA family prenyltransferase [Planctomycetota bacterium]|nr:UbiA family prenyltransferase [Planctomycetota bacterium]